MDLTVDQKTYIVGGVDIIFPYKPYPSQLSMMDKVVKSLTRKQNCLLESPTGSGKSLALLCSSLAWQKKIQNENLELSQKLENCVSVSSVVKVTASPLHNQGKMSSIVNESKDKNLQMPSVDIKLFRFEERGQCETKRNCTPVDDADINDFQPSKKYKIPFSPASSHSPLQFIPGKHDSVGFSPSRLSVANFSKINEKKKDLQKFPASVKSNIILQNVVSTLPAASFENALNTDIECQSVIRKTPKIFFGSRTHKQISQIIRELKKTPYKNVKMTILSSRERTCIHSQVSKMANKKEGCDDLLNASNGPACSYYRNSHRVSHQHPPSLAEAWDLEDFTRKCKAMRACPYFSTRALLQDSEIVFCPYNYLVDPLIRLSLDINLKDNIVIMDEAHNLEDAAREAASFSMTQNQLEETIQDLQRVAQSKKFSSVKYYSMAELISEFASWLSKNNSVLPDYNSFDTAGKVWSGEDMVAILSTLGVGPDSFKEVKDCFEHILKEESDAESNDEKLIGSSTFLLRGLLVTLGYIYRDQLKHMPDYRWTVIRKKKTSYSSSKWQNRVGFSATWELSVNFWCLSPAVAFADLKCNVHSLIVASGTLSPMASFQSELCTPFPITLEASHVVSRQQMWVGTIGNGPSGSPLNATYRNTETFSFQDDIGCVVLGICSVVPHGVLCFLPSYSMLEKLTSRWQMTGLWNKIAARKVVVCEPRGQNQDFGNVMVEYYEAIKESENSPLESQLNGALFIAVCRGKVSEGLDFADNNARAVITIGIPFPNVKDMQVDLKKKYNDMYCSKSNLMSGSEWYETQAFRALNQALGRCIRHRNDFGALIIVDERFQKQPRYVDSLSKWIRKEVTHYATFSNALTSLEEFTRCVGLEKVQETHSEIISSPIVNNSNHTGLIL